MNILPPGTAPAARRTNKDYTYNLGHVGSGILPPLREVGAQVGITFEGVRLVEGRYLRKLLPPLQKLGMTSKDHKVVFAALRGAYAQHQEDEDLSDKLAALALSLKSADPKLSDEDAISKASAQLFC